MPTRLVELHEDPRTELLTLQNVDTPPAPRAKRVIGLAVVLGVLAVIAIAEYAVLTTAAVVPNLLFLFGLGLVAAVVLLCRSRRLLSLRVSRPDAELAFVQGVPGESSNSTTLSCATVGSISLSVRHGADRSGRLAIPCSLVLHDLDGRVLLDEYFFVVGLDRDEELLDLAVRLGHAVGLGYYHVPIRDPRRFQVQVTRIEQQRAEPLPALLERPADYKSNTVLPGLVLPEEVLAAFDPSMPLSSGLRIGKWEPGRLITIVSRGALWRWAGGLASAAIALACAWGWRHPERLPFFGDDAWVWLVVAVVSGAIAMHLIRSGSFHARIDIRNGTARVQHGLLRRRVALQRVTEVVLTRHVQHGRVVTEARRGAHMFHTYRLELHGSDTGPFALLPALTTPFEDRQRALFDALHSFSISLASELARTHRYVETEEAAPG